MGRGSLGVRVSGVVRVLRVLEVVKLLGVIAVNWKVMRVLGGIRGVEIRLMILLKMRKMVLKGEGVLLSQV